MSLLSAALALAERGNPVFPCKPDKSPYTPHGFKDATINRGLIEGFWTRHPDALIGMPTGEITGVVVLDVDNKPGRDGAESLFRLEQEYGDLPDTVEALTPSGGRHLYFQAPAETVRNSNDALGPGLDIRAEGGYVCVPPSGVNGHSYEWEASNPSAPAPMPRWLLELVRAHSERECRPLSGAEIPDGQRNERLFKLASSLRSKGLTEAGILAALRAENSARCSSPLPESEVQRIAASAARFEAGSAHDGLQKNWPTPLPLPELRPPVPPFADSLLPERLRPWLKDIAERMQCPPEFPAVGALVALASLVGGQVGIRPKRYDDWVVVPNLWGAVIGRPGVMKTPALEEPLKPLHRLKHAAMGAHKSGMAAHEADTAAHEALITAAKKALAKEASKHIVDLAACRDARGALGKPSETLRELQESAPEAPTLRRYMTSDATPEKLGELLAENPTGILVYRDELVSWLKGLDRDGREEGRGLYLQGWNGTGSYTFDRILRGTVHVEAVCISILGGIQPGPLADYVWHASHNGAGNDGLLQRFQLLVWPDDSGTWRNVDRWPDTEAKNSAFAIFERLNAIDAISIAADTSERIPFLRFSPEGQDIFDEWRTALETEKLRAGEPEPLEAHLSKYRSLGPSLALLFHLVDNGKGPVTAQAAIRAFDWCEFLEAHARRVYGAATIRGLGPAHALAAKIREGRLPAEFTPRDVYRNDWSRLDKEGTTYALDVLSDWEWLRIETVATGGRPSKKVTLNPHLEARRG